MVVKSFVLKMTQAKTRIWPCLAYLFQVRSTAVLQSRMHFHASPPQASPGGWGSRFKVEGFLAQQKLQQNQDHHRALGIGLL